MAQSCTAYNITVFILSDLHVSINTYPAMFKSLNCQMYSLFSSFVILVHFWWHFYFWWHVYYYIGQLQKSIINLRFFSNTGSLHLNHYNGQLLEEQKLEQSRQNPCYDMWLKIPKGTSCRNTRLWVARVHSQNISIMIPMWIISLS